MEKCAKQNQFKYLWYTRRSCIAFSNHDSASRNVSQFRGVTNTKFTKKIAVLFSYSDCYRILVVTNILRVLRVLLFVSNEFCYSQWSTLTFDSMSRMFASEFFKSVIARDTVNCQSSQHSIQAMSLMLSHVIFFCLFVSTTKQEKKKKSEKASGDRQISNGAIKNHEIN